MSNNLLDTSTWLPLDGLAPGFDANKATPVTDLAGSRLTVHTDWLTPGSGNADGGTFVFEFGAGTVAWSAAGRSGDDAYEAFAVAEGLYYAQWQSGADPNFSVSLFLDLDFGRALFVGAVLGHASPGETAVRHQFLPGVIAGSEATGEPIAETTALIGRRVEWVYSDIHAYEHVYLSPQWYTWQCLAGPERGLADTDTNTTFQIRPGIYVFTWREKVIPCGSVTIADHRDATAIRSHGYLFGWDEAGTEPVHFTFGAHGRLISITSHTPEYDPSLPLG
jgi:hypothetical protein